MWSEQRQPASVPSVPILSRHVLTCALPGPVLLQVDYWKEQAGLPAHKRDYIDLENIKDERQNGEQDGM